jgi:predicted GNAT family N-acyltransferase
MTTAQIIIRRPTRDELAAVRAQRLRVMKGSEPAPDLQPDEADLRPDAIHMAAFASDGTVVAAIRATPIGADPNVYEISRLFTAESYRGQRIGSRVLAAIEQAAVLAGAKGFVLNARTSAENFYAHNGYWRTGRILHLDNGDTNHVMVKEVRE